MSVELIEDERSLNAASHDFGRLVSRRPRAIARPTSAGAIAELIGFARGAGLNVAPHGRRHSAGGQALVSDGLVLDLSSHARVQDIDASSVQVEAGACWADVLAATLPFGLAPPVLPDYLGLSIGGTLSVGGLGCQSVRRGAMTDHVLELQVVTGQAEVLTCSRQQHADLFDACRAGLGQFGVIARARIGLRPIVPQLRRYRVVYARLDPFLEDLNTLARRASFDTLQGFAAPSDPVALQARFGKRALECEEFASGLGRWIYYWEATAPGSFTESPAQVSARDAAAIAGLHCSPAACFATHVSYLDFARRVDSSFALMKQQGLWDAPHPWLHLLVPASRARAFLGATMDAMPVEDMGQGPVAIYPLVRSHFATPFLRLPAEEQFVLLALLRHAVPGTDAHVGRLLAANEAIEHAGRAIGAVRYPIDGPTPTRAAWAEHFGEVWSEFSARKRQFDPQHLLVPSQGLWEPGS